MAELSLEQVKFIEKDIQNRGLKNDSLISDLVDHVCCILEDELDEDTKFEDLYPTIINRFFKKDLLEVEEETNLLLTFKNYYAMRNTMIRSGMSALILLVIGIIFKTLHLPGTAIILILATVLITFVFLPIFFVFNTKNSNPQKKMVIGFGALFGILFVLAALFRVLHWPGAILLWRSSLLVVTFLFLPAYLFGSIRNEENKTNVIITSLMILIMSGILWGMTILSRTSVNVDQAIENQTLSLIDFSNSTKNLKSDELEKLNHLTSESKRLIIQIEEKLTREINKMENEKIDLKRSVSLYSNDIDISTNALFINDQPVNVLKQLKNNLFKINKLSGGQLFKTRINKNNWEVDNFSHLPLHMVVSYLQIIKIQLSIVVA